MRIVIVAALSRNRVIGKDNQLPWDIPADKEHLYALIRHKAVLMGRKTYESISHPLPNCRNLILSHDPSLSIVGCEVYATIEAALEAAKDEPELVILGGEKIYADFLPRAEIMYLTLIEHEFVGDTFFPEWNSDEWLEVQRESFAANSTIPYAYSFITLKRK